MTIEGMINAQRWMLLILGRYDGGEGSGNHGHKGRPGEVGGSAPKASNLNDSVKQYIGKPGGQEEADKAIRQAVSDMAPGMIVSLSGGKLQYVKNEDESFSGINCGDTTFIGIVNGARSAGAYDISFKDATEETKEETKEKAKEKEKENIEKNNISEAVEKVTPKEVNEIIQKVEKANPGYWQEGNGSLANEVAVQLGLNKPPKTLSPDKFEELAKEPGATVIYRGVDDDYEFSNTSKSTFVREFLHKEDDSYGGGNFGFGYHFSREKSEAEGYAHGDPRGLIECIISPEAKLVPFSAAKKAAEEAGTDISTWALINGYDGIKAEGESKVINILNRHVLVAKDKMKKDGGPGSGNFGHEGRPGKIGGSAPDSGSTSEGDLSERVKYYAGALADAMSDHKPIRVMESNDKKYDRIKNIVSSCGSPAKKCFEKVRDDICIINDNPNITGETEKGIRVNLEKSANDERGEYTSFFHEVGHRVDRLLGRPSNDPDFSIALRRDFEHHIARIMSEQSCGRDDAIQHMTNSLNKKAVFHGAADIMNGLTRGKANTIYHHKEHYWKANAKNLPREAFAHFYEAEIRSDESKKATLSLMYPSAYKMFLESLENVYEKEDPFGRTS